MARPKGSGAIKIDPSRLSDIEQMAAVGLTIDQMAALLEMSGATLERIKKKNLAVSEAIEKGRAKAIFQVGKSAYNQAISGKIPAMTMFYLKCRAGWKETVVQEHQGKIETENKNKYESMAIDELSAAYRKKCGEQK